MKLPTVRRRRGWLADPDAYWGEAGLVGEVDSLEWHLDPASWGRTLRRHERLEAAGFRVIHCTPRHIAHEGRARLASLEGAYLAGRRSGTPSGVLAQSRRLDLPA